jgi:hypothetical protein
MGIDYTQQKLWEAMNSLIGTGTLQERLKGAAQFLILLPAHDPAFPAFPDLEERLNRVLQRLTAVASSGEGSIEATTQRLSDRDANEVAAEILSLFSEATRAAKFAVVASSTAILPGDVH